jgi:hypothetical protein
VTDTALGNKPCARGDLLTPFHYFSHGLRRIRSNKLLDPVLLMHGTAEGLISSNPTHSASVFTAARLGRASSTARSLPLALTTRLGAATLYVLSVLGLIHLLIARTELQGIFALNSGCVSNASLSGLGEYAIHHSPYSRSSAVSLETSAWDRRLYWILRPRHHRHPIDCILCCADSGCPCLVTPL